MQIINLLPDVQLEKRKRHQKNTLITLIFIVTTGAVLLTCAGLLGYLVIRNSVKTDLLASIDGLSEEAQDTDLSEFGVEVTDPRTGETRLVHIEVAGKLVQNQLSTISKLLSNRLAWKLFLYDLGQIMPKSVSLGGVSVAENLSVTISVKADTFAAASQFVNAVKNYRGDLVKAAIGAGVLIDKDGVIYLKDNLAIDKQICQSTPTGQLCGANADAVRELLLSPAGERLKLLLKAELKDVLAAKPPVFTNVSFDSVEQDSPNSPVTMEVTFNAKPDVMRR